MRPPERAIRTAHSDTPAPTPVIDLPPRVKEELDRQDRTVAWLARRAGIHPSYALRMLKGERPITDEFKAAVAIALGTDLDDLFPTEVAS